MIGKKGKGRRCPRCKGKGTIYHPGINGLGFFPTLPSWESKCDLCAGTGKVNQ